MAVYLLNIATWRAEHELNSVMRLGLQVCFDQEAAPAAR